ncbi:MAG TPA: aminotransferase class III-fold pyridoxal phosphate-dependent enzyme [Pirellulales bacterium]|jgi:glutamate-1-semialdehyde 2,1-aminomutase|nr:aminotransferase class III-fold pyridoxal phosphate-dependent enzyme [Pirellulales bacterium]
MDTPGDPLAFFNRFLRTFVPPDSFDAHLHLYRQEDAIDGLPRSVLDEHGNASWAAYCRAVETWMGDRRPTGGLIFTIPKPTLDMSAANRFVADEVRRLPGSRAQMMIHPHDDPATVEATLAADGFVGFKVYHVYSGQSDTLEAPTETFLPEWAWELAERHSLSITLHMVLARALADPRNSSYIREHCLRYPHARLILAHAARGFCGYHTVEAIDTLRGLDNVYFDTSAVCEAAPMEAILREFGTGRLLFGTDFSVSELTGRCVSIGDGFLWLYGNNFEWSKSRFAQPHLIGLESLLAIKQACHTLRLRDDDVERIFCSNGRRMFGIGEASTGEKTAAAYQRARQIIPGGTQLLSKRPEMYAPGRWPAYFREARGCEVIDLDGRRYCDMTTSGIGSCLLGYADPDVSDAVIRRVGLSSMGTLNCVEELELAERLIALHPWAEQARFCRSGGESMAVAVRIARALTGRDQVAFCGYHGWSDWYLAANLPSAEAASSGGTDRLQGHLLPGLAPAGVPAGLAGTMLPFAYNRLDELEQHFRRHGSQIAAVVMEPTRSVHPEPGFLEGVRELCRAHGAVLVFDEITVGWRFALGGAHLTYGVEPDMAVFAKALGNGHPIGAIIGRGSVMQAAQTSFISSTYWTEGVGPTAALATICKLERVDAPAYVERIGGLMRAGWQSLGRKHGVPVKMGGHPAILSLGFDHPDAAALGTLVTTRMLDHGFLTGGGFYPSLAHEPRHVEAYLAAADNVFAEVAEAIHRGDVQSRLEGRVRHTGFARLA